MSKRSMNTTLSALQVSFYSISIIADLNHAVTIQLHLIFAHLDLLE